MSRRLIVTAAAAVVFCWLVPALNADVVFGTVSSTAPPSQTNEEAVLLTQGATGTNTGGSVYLIQGTTSVGGVTVNISTDNSGSSGIDQLYANSAVQLYANPLGSTDTSIDQLSFNIPGHTFGDIYMNLFGLFETGYNGGTNDSVQFMVTTNDGTFTHTYSGLTGDNTNNWILISTSGDEQISSVSLADVRFYALEDLHVSGVTTPEPASLLLTGSGLALCFTRFKRKS